MDMSPQEQRALEVVLQKATTDLAFREQLLTNPRRAIQEAYGVRIPASFRIKFIERDPDVDALVVLPDYQDPSGQLSDDTLDAVAGGAGDPPTTNWSDEIP
jgi:hypothetical protein